MSTDERINTLVDALGVFGGIERENIYVVMDDGLEVGNSHYLGVKSVSDRRGIDVEVCKTAAGCVLLH